jgi:hypothetical protein
MKITKHTTVALTIGEVKQSLFDYQSEIMSDMLLEYFSIPYDSGKFCGNVSVDKQKLLEWSNLLLKGTHSAEFKKLNNGLWTHTPSFNSGFVELIESNPNLFLNTSLFDGLNAKDFSVVIVHENDEECILNSRRILDNI